MEARGILQAQLEQDKNGNDRYKAKVGNIYLYIHSVYNKTGYEMLPNFIGQSVIVEFAKDGNLNKFKAIKLDEQPSKPQAEQSGLSTKGWAAKEKREALKYFFSCISREGTNIPLNPNADMTVLLENTKKAWEWWIEQCEGKGLWDIE